MKQRYEKQLLDKAKNLVSVQNTNDVEKCKAEFEEEWKQWIQDVPECKGTKYDINEFMVLVLLQEKSDLNADMLKKLQPVDYKISTFINGVDFHSHHC